MVVPRLPGPLPAPLRAVATTLLTVYGSLFVIGALYVMGGGASVVLMPLIMGRAGVGTAMITLFTVCVTFVASGVLLLAARSAARVVRREPLSVRPLYLFAVWSLAVVLIVGALTQWLSVAFYGSKDAGDLSFDWSVPVRAVELLAALILVWAVMVLRQFDRQFRMIATQ